MMESELQTNSCARQLMVAFEPVGLRASASSQANKPWGPNCEQGALQVPNSLFHRAVHSSYCLRMVEMRGTLGDIKVKESSKNFSEPIVNWGDSALSRFVLQERQDPSRQLKRMKRHRCGIFNCLQRTEDRPCWSFVISSFKFVRAEPPPLLAVALLVQLIG